jgi:hypothetical protein
LIVDTDRPLLAGVRVETTAGPPTEQWVPPIVKIDDREFITDTGAPNRRGETWRQTDPAIRPDEDTPRQPIGLNLITRHNVYRGRRPRPLEGIADQTSVAGR